MLNVLAALGVTVVVVPKLHDWVCYVESQHLGLIREGLDDEDLLAAIDWLTEEALLG